MHVCIHVCMCVRMYVYVCMYACTRIEFCFVLGQGKCCLGFIRNVSGTKARCRGTKPNISLKAGAPRQLNLYQVFTEKLMVLLLKD